MKICKLQRRQYFSTCSIINGFPSHRCHSGQPAYLIMHAPSRCQLWCWLTVACGDRKTDGQTRSARYMNVKVAMWVSEWVETSQIIVTRTLYIDNRFFTRQKTALRTLCTDANELVYIRSQLRRNERLSVINRPWNNRRIISAKRCTLRLHRLAFITALLHLLYIIHSTIHSVIQITN